jgi:Tol biopolymer transport system component
VLYYSQAPDEAPEMHLQVITPRTPDPGSFGNSLAFSPDGRSLVFVGFSDDGQTQLWLRSLDNVTASPIEGTEGVRLPFWSPNSRSIGFFADSKLKRIDVAGGPPIELADAPNGIGGTWNRDGIIVFAPSQTSQLFQVSDSGTGEPVPVTLLDPPRQTAHSFPQFLPNGRHLLFHSSGDESQGIFLTSLDSSETKLLSPMEGPAFYAAPGYLLFMRQNTLFARSFNVKQGILVGDEVWIADSVVADEQSKLGVFSASETGMLAYRTGETPLRQLALFDRSGKEVETISAPDRNNIESPEISPDGSNVAICRLVQGDSDVWLIKTIRGGRLSRFTDSPSTAEVFPIWSPDSERIVFASYREGTFGLCERPLNEIEDRELYLDSSANIFPNDWSTDGQHILYLKVDPDTGRDLWMLPLFGEKEPFNFLKTSSEERNGQFSPDGQLIAYESNESGRFEVYVRPFKDVGRKHSVSTEGGIAPRWRPDGKELFYIAPDGKLMATPILGAGQTLSIDLPEPLFQTQIVGGGTAAWSKIQYDVLPDGQHFLINKAIDDPSASPINIITNWTRALKK